MIRTTSILDFIATSPDVEKVLSTVKNRNEATVYGLMNMQKTLLTATVVANQGGDILVICDTPKRAKEIWEDLVYLLPTYQVMFFPALEIIPFEVLAQSNEIERQRLEVLANLILSKQNKVVICTVESLSKGLMPPEKFKQGFYEITVGQIVELDQLKQYLVQYGYERVEQVEQNGQFSIRGGIVDVFSANYKDPIRLEFFDDEVDSIRFFQVDNQRSIEKVNTVTFAPAREFFYDVGEKDRAIDSIKEELDAQLARLAKKKDRNITDRLRNKVGEVIEKVQQNVYFHGLEQFQAYFYPQGNTLLSYLGKNGVVCLEEAIRIEEAQRYIEKERMHSFADLLASGSVLPGQSKFFLEFEEMVEEIKGHKRLVYSLLPKPSIFVDSNQMENVETKSITPFFNKMQLLVDDLKELQRKNYAVMILVTSEAKGQRLIQSLQDHDVEAVWVEEAEPTLGKIYVTVGNLNEGAAFVGCRLAIITENEIFQQQKKRVTKRMFQEDGQRIVHLDDLEIGDFVVHVNHGIGRYLGVERLKVGDVERDYLIIKYAGEDKLYVPIDQFDLLQKYVVNEGSSPKVHKLGGADWQKTKTKVKASVRQLAEGLLELYAKRKTQPGYQFAPDDQLQREFEENFPYVETEDQLKAIEEVKADMMKPSAMDRLICGDVGYGKTEVAIRAAFKAVNDGKQVAVLVPTTVLAQQHYNTFKERFTPYGVNVEVMSRFRTAKDQKEVKLGVKNGTVDIVIGTHRLLNKDMAFKDLGLLVVDEEQRFGVTHKEKIKGLKSQVDVLTLSATPIPRTLHMSLVGIRDMSVIETPPQDRYPIQTYVVEHTPELLKDAVRRELGRGGQVFYVHNRIDDIDQVAEELTFLVPEARIAVGHGQMKETELEKIMLDFMNQEVDVLICTTIIETGLDIANANTLIIDEADKMGLSQLYQLRGRVGRSNRVAYAYLTYKKDKALTQLAEKRLAAVREYTELGSGFKIAMRDLEIRGAGNLLGPEQHGQVASVGFDLYCKLLDDAIRELKGEFNPEEMNIEIDLQVNSFIPDYYIKDSATKLGFYQRIQKTKSANRVMLIEEELEDRFGDLPEETRNLLEIARIKAVCYECRVKTIKQKAGIVTIGFHGEPPVKGPQLFDLASKFKRRLNYSSEDNKLVLKLNVGSLPAQECLDLIKKVLSELIDVVRKDEDLL